MRRRAFIKTAAGIFIPAIQTAVAQVPMSLGDGGFLGRKRPMHNFAQIFTTATNTVKTTTTIGLGYSDCAGCAYHGYTAEYLFYDHKLTAGDRTSVRTYLNTKYGLSL